MEKSEIPHGGCPRAEYETARLVLMHTPGEEVFCGAMHPAAALYEKYMDVKRAGDEHRAYVEFLRNEAGAEVVTVREILEGTETGELREFASRFLTYSVRVLAAEDRAAAEEYRRETLEQMTKEELIRVILLRPTLHLRRSVRNTGWRAEYALRPLMNLFYMRDQMINTPRGPVIGRMNSEQRAEEADVAELPEVWFEAFCLLPHCTIKKEMAITVRVRIARVKVFMLVISLKFISLYCFLFSLSGVGRDGAGDAFFTQVLVVADVRTGEMSSFYEENLYSQEYHCQGKKPCGKK